MYRPHLTPAISSDQCLVANYARTCPTTANYPTLVVAPLNGNAIGVLV